MGSKKFWLVVVAALALIAAACGDDDDDDAATDDTTPAEETTAPPDEGGGDDELDGGGGDDELDGGTTDTTEPAGDDPCAGVTLEATEIGITEDTITVLVMADVGSELAPGLFQGSIDGVKAWAQKVNENGGLACRQVEVVEFDSAINPTETTNGILRACDEALAMVGSTSLFVTDISALDACPDLAGNAIGIPDIPERAVAAIHSCSPNVFTAAGSNGLCPYSGEGPRDYVSMMGPYQQILATDQGGGPVTGAYLIPSDLPTTIAASMPTARALNAAGVDTLGCEFGVTGSAEQAVYGQYIQCMRDTGATWAQTGSNDQSMIKWRKEAAAQGFDDTGVSWICSLACYTPDFINQGGADVEGTYVWMQFLPFAETDANEELARFIEYMGDPQPASWAAGAWASGVMFEQVVNEIVAASGPNGITRQGILDGLNGLTEFDANGWYGGVDVAGGGLSPCFVLLQVQGGEYVRVHPAEPGTFDCEADNLVEQPQMDAAAEFQG